MTFRQPERKSSSKSCERLLSVKLHYYMLPTGSNHLLYYLKSRCILEARNPDELASFSKKIFMKMVRIFCPLWFDCVWGASGLSQNASKECSPEINSLALATATLARLRNAKAPAVHYRISTFMFHSGVKYGDLTSLNYLEVCMSPDWQLRLNRTNQELHSWANGVWQNNNDFRQA